MTFEQAVSAPVWDLEFWMALKDAQQDASKALSAMREELINNDGTCICDTCITRTVLEAVWPTMTEQVMRIAGGSTPRE
jgi:hypothetical protein